MDHTLLSLVLFDCSVSDGPVKLTGLESVFPRSRHSLLVLVARALKLSAELVLELRCATKVLSVEAVTVTCIWLDEDL